MMASKFLPSVVLKLRAILEFDFEILFFAVFMAFCLHRSRLQPGADPNESVVANPRFAKGTPVSHTATGNLQKNHSKQYCFFSIYCNSCRSFLVFVVVEMN